MNQTMLSKKFRYKRVVQAARFHLYKEQKNSQNYEMPLEVRGTRGTVRMWIMFYFLTWALVA